MAATKRAIDFSNVKEQGNFNTRRVQAGQYKAKITAADDHKSNAGNEGWVLSVVLDGKRGSYPYYLQSSAEAAWKVRNVLVAAGLTVPKKRVNVDINKVVGKAIGVEMDDDEYEGKPKSVIVDVFPVSELDGKATKSTKSRAADDEDDSDDDDLDDVDLEEI